MIAIICLERGMPSRGASSERPDFVPALCTHRPSLLPIGWSGEDSGLRAILCSGLLLRMALEKLFKPYHLEEGEVVTRFP